MSPAGGRAAGAPRALWVAAGLLVATLWVVLATVPGSSAAFTARVVDTTNTLTTAPYFSCRSAAVADAAGGVYPLDDNPPSNGASARDVSGNGRLGSYQTTATHSTSSPCTRDGGGSTTFNGSGNFVSIPYQVSNPQVFSVETWFETSTASGVLVGFSNSLLGLVPTSWDRVVYLTTDGRLVFGVRPGGTTYVTVTSTDGYADGAWHHVIASLGPAGTLLYVDGRLVASDPNTAAQVYNGWWRVGYTYLLGWPGAVGTSYYFNGQLGYAALYTTQLSATAVANHAAAGR